MSDGQAIMPLRNELNTVRVLVIIKIIIGCG